MEQIRRNKTKYTSPYTSSWPTKKPADARILPEEYWKYLQRNTQEANDKNTRRHQNPISEPTVSYYSSANSYKTLKRNSYPRSMHLKYPSGLTEVPQLYQQNTTKSGKNKDYTNNVAVVNKDRYKNRQEDDSNVEYIDEELGNFTEDNLEDDVEEEAENDQERVGESLNKEYDEQEADDEVDEESDALAEPHAIQRNTVKKDASLRTQQRMQIINQQQNPHRVHYSQYSPKLYQAHPSPTRYYRNVLDRDIHEAMSEEDLYTAQALKNPPRRLSAGCHQNWIPHRNSTDRYDTITSPKQSSRRAQTRPEMKSYTEAELVDRKKCSRCGNVSIRRHPRNFQRNNCRFQDNPNISTKGHY
ncbi:LOW QUALITY PROTEIN: uncharacterized protein LOC114931271, partial [Nylanderia fulva]|uniref:LOW QUALITY PROTEIN: uncharacterized protein LOC114931271 n=1 Tax=Nylanderia fulva TaxID=613905 RepID=UPI0010FB18E7